MKKTIIYLAIGVSLAIGGGLAGYNYAKPAKLNGSTKLKAEFSVDQWNGLISGIGYQVAQMDTAKHKDRRDTVGMMLMAIAKNIDSVNHLKP